MTCPECGGPHLPSHPAGALTFQHVPGGCNLGVAQDQTAVADYDRLGAPFAPAELDRPATAAEVTLAAALGLPTPDAVTIRRVTDSAAVTHRQPA